MSSLHRPSHHGGDPLVNGSATPFSHHRTPSRAGILRASSPTSTYTPTITSGNTKMNVVTRIAIEGVSQPSVRETGAEIRMYLKIAIPLENVVPGMTIPLFPEDSVRITMSQVHPLDQHSTPYHFPTEHHPLLYKAAKALNLSHPSSVQYRSVFASLTELSSSGATSSSSNHSDGVAPVDPHYAGHILVSGYQVCYILPKEFPPLQDPRSYSSRSRTPYKNRRSSLGEKSVLQFMAAIQMYIPYITTPPRHPYLLSIPTPRCLQNSIKFRVIANKPVSTSLASLSSVEEDNWDFSVDPVVTQKPSRLARADSLNNDFADDESSDSSVTDKMVSSIQGAFQSTDRIRIRWAKPARSIVQRADTQDGRSRIGVERVKGEMRCSVLGIGRDSERLDCREGVVMRVEYTGTCTGLWFPGVATLVGMDVGFIAKGADVTWVDGYNQCWTVTGGRGFTGSSVGGPQPTRQSVTDSTTQASTTTTPDVSPVSSISRRGSRSSLIRAPLPTQHLPEYSFEGSNALTPSATLSSIGSLTPSTSSAIQNEESPKAPGSPIAVHINMNEFDPPANINFSFTITGVCLLTPKHSHQKAGELQDPSSSNTENDSEIGPDPVVVLPRFSVLATHAEAITTIVENKVDSDGLKLSIYKPSGDISRDAQALKTVLQKGGSATCTDDGGRVSLRSISRPVMNGFAKADISGHARTAVIGPTTPLGTLNGSMSLIPSRTAGISKRRRDGPLLIPYVMATVTPLQLNRTAPLDAYAVRVSLPVPFDPNSEYLEFGIAQIGSSFDGSSGFDRPPTIDIASASVDGVPVRCDITVPKQERDTGPQLEQLSGQEWLSWVTVHTAGFDGGILIVDYVVKEVSNALRPKSKWKGKTKDTMSAEVFLPAFSLSVGRLEVVLDSTPGFRVMSLQSNLAHQETTSNGCQRLLHFTADPAYLPRLSVRMSADSSNSILSVPSFSSAVQILFTSLLLVLSFITVFGLTSLGTEIQRVHRTLDTYSLVMDPDWRNPPEAVTVTTTVYATSVVSSPWRVAESCSDQPSVSPTAPALHSADVTTSAAPLVTPSPPSPPSIQGEDALGDVESDDNDTLASSPLLIAYHEIINWPLSLDNVDIHVALDKVLQTADVVWQVLRRVYHYPLPPP